MSSSSISDELVMNLLNECKIEESEDLKLLASKIDRKSFEKKLRHSIDVILEAIDLTRKGNGNNELCLSFNGGKDCCVVLFLFYKVALKTGFITQNSDSSNKHKFNILIMKLNESFREVDEFVDQIFQSFYTSADINRIVLEKPGVKLKKCLEIFKQDYPNILSVLMGTRRTDNQYVAKLKDFHETDPDWPKFIRVNPILDWSYSEIWYFLKRFNAPYCSLYDNGYTSLGDIANTIKNEALYDAQLGVYKPAYTLENEYKERNSRI